MRLSIIIPVYNEEKTIIQILNKINKIRLPRNFKKEVIVIDDGSLDSTPKKLSEEKIGDYKYFRHEKNLGKGGAIRTGLKEATGELILIQDADLEYDPIFYSSLLEPFINNKTEVVYGTRLKDYPLNLWGEKKTVLPAHLIANWFLTSLTNFLYCSNLTDMETGYKIFKRKIFQNIKIEANRFDFEVEVTAKILKRGIEIIEIPITVNPRTYQEGKKIGWKDGIAAIWALFKYKFID